MLISGDCDHLDAYPVYSETRNFNSTSWYKPWPPEIDFLNSYVNLSLYHYTILDAIFIGYKITTFAKYYANSEWGCILMFPWDPDLADAYYLEYYANSNETLVICTPHIPVRPDLRRKMIEFHNNIYSMLRCDVHKLGYYKSLHKQRSWSFTVSSNFPLENRIYLIIAYLTSVTGIFGEY